MVCGDLNVAHQETLSDSVGLMIGDVNSGISGQDIDIWNPEATRIKRQAGTTALERQSFASLLAESLGHC